MLQVFFLIPFLYFMKSAESNYVEQFFLRPRIVGGSDSLIATYNQRILYATVIDDHFLFQLADIDSYTTPIFHYDHDEKQTYFYGGNTKYYLRSLNYYLQAYAEPPEYEYGFSLKKQSDGTLQLTRNPRSEPNYFVNLVPSDLSGNYDYVGISSNEWQGQNLQNYYLEGQPASSSGLSTYYPTASVTSISTSTSTSSTSSESTSTSSPSSESTTSTSSTSSESTTSTSSTTSESTTGTSTTSSQSTTSTSSTSSESTTSTSSTSSKSTSTSTSTSSSQTSSSESTRTSTSASLRQTTSSEFSTTRSSLPSSSSSTAILRGNADRANTMPDIVLLIGIILNIMV